MAHCGFLIWIPWCILCLFQEHVEGRALRQAPRAPDDWEPTPEPQKPYHFVLPKDTDPFRLHEEAELKVLMNGGKIRIGRAWVMGNGTLPNTYNLHIPGAGRDLHWLYNIPAAALQHHDYTKGPWERIIHPLARVPPVKYNCTKDPLLCSPPFECHSWTSREKLVWFYYGAAPDGHANLRMWCEKPELALYAHQCVAKKNLALAASWRYKATATGQLGRTAADLDASHCFIQGHCLDANVTASTTLEQATELCNRRFGDRWTKVKSVAQEPKDKVGYGGTPYRAFKTTKQSTPHALLACAMGRFHCDVMYCKANYCQHPAYLAKYGHHLHGKPVVPI